MVDEAQYYRSYEQLVGFREERDAAYLAICRAEDPAIELFDAYLQAQYLVRDTAHNRAIMQMIPVESQRLTEFVQKRETSVGQQSIAIDQAKKWGNQDSPDEKFPEVDPKQAYENWWKIANLLSAETEPVGLV